MTVAHDAFTASSQWTTTPDPFTFTHTPVGTPRGVLLFVISAGSTDPVNGAVTYGGVSMTAVSGGRAVDTATEPGACKTYFLGASIPTGAQTVSIDWDTGHTGTKIAVCVTVTAASDTAVSGTPVLLEDDGTVAEQTINTGASQSVRYAGGFSGRSSSNIAPGASTTGMTETEVTNATYTTGRETTPGTGSRDIGFVAGTSDDRALVHLGIIESGGGGGAVTSSMAVVIS